MTTKLLPLLIAIFLYSSSLTFGADVLKKAEIETKQVLQSSKSSDHLIRQCSCPEEQNCIQQMEGQVRDCFQTCWGEQRQQVNQLTSNPDQLKQCFARREHLIDEFIHCVKNNEQTCVNNNNGPQIPYINLDKLLGAGEQRLRSQAQAFLRTTGAQQQKLVQTAVNVGTCIKSCFMKSNSRGSCFDQTGCQPKLEENLVGPIIKRCARQIQWKREAGEMCDCALNAGVLSLKPYCQILHGADRKSVV